jgi:cell division protein FtsB
MKFLQSCRGFARRNLSVLLGVGLLLLLVQDVFGTHGVLAMRRSKKEAADIQREINRLESENCGMEQGVENLKSDPQTIERIARDEMGLAKPGEYIFKLPPKPGSTSTSSSGSISASPSGCPAPPPPATSAAPPRR